MLAALLFCSWKVGAGDSCATALNSCRLIIVGIYFWSGTQKLNFEFVHHIAPFLFKPYLPGFPGGDSHVSVALGFVMACGEITIGVGLLTKRFRNTSVVLSVFTHLIILLLVIPLRRNAVVWPWNVAIAASVVILFWRERDISVRDILYGGGHVYQVLMLLLFGVMPVLSYFNLWDSFPSSTLYSRNTTQAVLHLSDPVFNRLPTVARRGARIRGDDNLIDINQWSYAELNVPAYPEPRIYRNVARLLCAYAETPSDVILEIQGKPRALDGVRQITTLRCEDLSPPQEAKQPAR
jgi:hypothetical protein